MDFTTITVNLLKGLAEVSGNYGLAIIILTIIMRLALWPLNTSQQRSMRKMQTLSPKLKDLQNRYKSDPQMMQKKMMEFYKEHSFNPFGGCFPLLVQMPIFILLYSALISPQFQQVAGESSFLFIDHLSNTMRSHAGVANDGKFGVSERDTFSASKVATVYLEGGEVKEVKIQNNKKAIEIQGDIQPGQPMDLKISLDDLKMKFSDLAKVEKAELSVTNNATKETEDLSFERKDSLLLKEVPTEETENVLHYDVLVLVLLFGASMYFSQKFMMASNKQVALDPNQQAMQQSMANIMPFMITGMFVFLPIPAGVLLYMIVSNLIQVLQSYLINKKIDAEEQAVKHKIDESKVNQAKKIN